VIVLAIEGGDGLPPSTRDAVSRILADMLRERCREHRVGVIDTLRFAVVLRQASSDDAPNVANNLRDTVTTALRPIHPQLTVRIGVASSDATGRTTAATLWSAAIPRSG
jgi:GGDEF domain-containing protein